ncbi:hypothetical protein BJF79_12525 [Actinomadura sp. CNU-125]|uniref:hypothetical protein n=1 Tax=Actinomadura sp. CNU-125 TaxID=1904961 RepID=UPI000968CB07|nr:hypothetical protein [Actinomadura sp. CNU-125]OLT25944.1 hypothetical protein BJF79_12525 [Actinomadura sp. CNU-125]
MTRPWDADHDAEFQRRLGKTAAEVGASRTTQDCPEIWELDNGDIAVIGREATDAYAGRLPKGVSIGQDERLVIIPGRMLSAAKPDIRDA